MTNIVKSADNERLMPEGREVGLVVGYVDEVNGPGATEVAGFVPTRHELIQLVKYWAGVRLHHRWSYFMYRVTGSTEYRQSVFAENRIARIAKLLGYNEVKKAVQEVYDEFGERSERLAPRLWQIFLHGDEAAWDAVSTVVRDFPWGDSSEFEKVVQEAYDSIQQRRKSGIEGARDANGGKVKRPGRQR